uniref:Sister chromatid cohesion protein PDS5 homolog B-like isoform X1 n=1 Tax=Tanacetum cinerariifolium TaxID=118510 RepID=A0A6L2J7Y4_TANCI|nr:sister chromatid cohesion protein PDS5 homolog B-like isoform X1 [Tanacetum cinerariifolium]
MAEKIKSVLEDVGSKLDKPPANKDALIKILKQAAASLSELEQSPSKALLESIQPFIYAIVKPELLKHNDKEVKLLVATCTCEITRVTAPEAPYDDEILKDIFHLIVSTFSGLRDTKGPSFGRRVNILETVAKYKSCIVMLDLECDDLINEMFRTFFAVARANTKTKLKSITITYTHQQAAASLSELEQSPSKALLESIQPFIYAIVKPELLKHNDKEVKLLVATCTCEITRVTAPEAPYDDEILKDIFHLIVSTFSGLRDTKGPSFGRRVNILETVAKTFFAVASDDHSEAVITSMKTIMVVLLEESEDINEDLLLIILSVLGRNKKGINMSARKLAMNVIGQCSGKLEPGIKQFIVKSMSGEASSSSSQIDYHEVIYDVYRCAPQALTGIVPYLSGELLTDRIDVRLKAVKLVGDLFSIQGSSIPDTFQPIFLEFLKRLTDKVVEVRMSVLEHVKLCMLSDSFRSEAPQLIGALCDRLLDYDESIRQKVVAVVSDLACHELSSILPGTIKLVADRLRDKSLPVKKYTMERVCDIYRTSCSKRISEDYDWIPGRVLRCFYDKDFRSDTVEHILCTSMFPTNFSVKDKVKTWIRLFSKFDKVEVKAVEKILEQKQRLQSEFQKYLSLRQTYKESDASELQKKVILKDANVWKILTTLLDPATSSRQTCKSRDELLKIVGQKHPLYGFLSILSMKCSYLLFNKDHVKEILLEAKASENKLLTQSCMNILVILASFSPLLLSGTEKDLVHLLEDENEVIKEGVLHVLAKAGGMIREQLGESSSTLDLILERICLEGSRRQAKYAVHALAAITKDDGLKSLSVLYKKLVDMLEKKTHLPSVLQSLGCIAQTAMPVFETQETKIHSFIKTDILGCSETTSDETKESWDDRSELCSSKIYGIKTLVKSYLPVKDAHLRVGIGELIKDLHNILSFGEISKDIGSSSVDKAHLKLASAKAILRLSKHWDKNITVDVFYLTLRTSEAGFPEVKKLFLKKVHQYIKDRSLDPKYACAFLLGLGSLQSVQEKKSAVALAGLFEHRNLNDIIQMCQQGKARHISVQSDGNSSVVHPEYILPYLIHALAHDPSCPDIDECKDVKAYEPIYRKLHIYLSMLAHEDEAGNPGKNLKKEGVISVLSVLQSIRSSEDAVDTIMSKKSYAICDLCFSSTKRLAQKQEDLQELAVHVPLPQGLYKPREKKEEKEAEKDMIEEKEKDEDMKDEKDKEENDKGEDEKHVTVGQTWLAEATALAHFETLNLDVDESDASKSAEDDMMIDLETDGAEVPLGEVLKWLKAKGAKQRKSAKNLTTPSTTQMNSDNNYASNNNKNNDDDNNNFDILGMVREIDLENSVVSTIINGHGETRTDEKRKRKRIPTKSITASVPKRQKSRELSAFDSIKMSISEDKPSLGTTDSDVRGHIETEHDNADDSDLPKPNQKSGPVKKRKRRRVSGLVKCTSKEGENHTTDLIGRRIKVWWPMDKSFYEGLVKSYDHQKKKHVVLYNDGDVEVVRLDKERWELIANTPKPKKRIRSSKSQLPKKGPSNKKIKVSDNSKKNKESSNISPSSMVRGNGTPRKSTRRRRKNLKYLDVERKEDSDNMSEPENEFQHDTLTFSKVENLDTDEETSDREQESDEEKQAKDAENSFSDPESSNEIESDSRQKETDNESGSGQEEEKQSSSSSSEKSTEDEAESQQTDPDTEDEAELSDDMPLGVWKAQVRKPDESK